MIVEKQDSWGRRTLKIGSGCPVYRTRESINKFFDALPADVEICGFESTNAVAIKLTLTSSVWPVQDPYPELQLKISHELKIEVL